MRHPPGLETKYLGRHDRIPVQHDQSMRRAHERYRGAIVKLVGHELGDRQARERLLEDLLDGLRQQRALDLVTPQKNRLLAVRALRQFVQMSALALRPLDQRLGGLPRAIEANFDRGPLDLDHSVFALSADSQDSNREASWG